MLYACLLCQDESLNGVMQPLDLPLGHGKINNGSVSSVCQIEN